MARLKWMWGIGAAFAMVAGLLTWVLGFQVARGQSFVTTTLALLICLGGYWFMDARKRRWSWVLLVVALPLGFYFNYVSPYFPLPSVLIGFSLLFALLGTLVREAPAPDPAGEDGDGEEGGDGEPAERG